MCICGVCSYVCVYVVACACVVCMHVQCACVYVANIH